MRLTFRLSRQMKDVLQFLDDGDSDCYMYSPSEMIQILQGEVTNSRKSSTSRTLRTLIKHGLVEKMTSKEYVSENIEERKSINLNTRLFYLTKTGKRVARQLREATQP